MLHLFAIIWIRIWISRMSVKISGAQLVRVCTVLQDCADQLAVLGNIMPDTYQGRPEADMVGYVKSLFYFT